MGKMGNFDRKDFKFVSLNIVFAIIIGVVILFFLILWLNNYTQHGKEVEVADVRGMSIAEASQTLSSLGLQMDVVDSTYSNKVPFGTIVEQDPKPQSHAKHGRLVYVTINASSRPMVVMPNLQDMSSRQAETTLRGLGLRVDENYEYEPSTFRDLVLDVKSGGKSIEPGTKLAQGTRVRLVVGYGRGTEHVTVPSVIGLTLQAARSALLRRHLTPGAILYDEEVPEGETAIVYQQMPEPGQRLVEGETVTLRLSIHPDKAAHNRVQTTEEEDSWF